MTTDIKDKLKSLFDYKIKADYSIMIEKRFEELNEEDIIPATVDRMFKLMFSSSSRIKYTHRLLSYFEDELPSDFLKRFEFYKNEFDMDNLNSKHEFGDIVFVGNNFYVNMEMNNNNTLDRNMEYLDRLYRYGSKRGSDYSYPEGLLQINLNNFYFEEHEEKAVDIYRLQNAKGETIFCKTIIQIYIPIIVKKLYNEGIEKLNDFERFIVLITRTKIKDAKIVAKGDELMNEYIKDAKELEKDDILLKGPYDEMFKHRSIFFIDGEAKGIEKGRIEGEAKGRTEGLEEGMEKGIEKGKLQVAKQLIGKMPIEEVVKLTGLSKESILMSE